MPNFDVADLALQAVAPGNKLLYDDKGLPSVMVYVPKFKLSEVITGGNDAYHPAFIINGSVVDGIYIGKYQSVVENGRAYSLPGRDPAISMTWDTARGYCEAKGAGWHMMTKAEWGMIALWCKAHGIFPKGNNNYGMDTTETAYQAIPATYGSDRRVNHTLTGTGPLTWSHDGTMKGIMDLNGNVSEWEGAYRTVRGELQFLANNNGADKSHSQTATSDQWMAIDASTGLFVTPESPGSTTRTIKVDCVSGKPKYSITVTTTSPSFNSRIDQITCSDDISEAAKKVLRAYGLLPEDGASQSDYGDGDQLYFNNEAEERLAVGGGNCTYATSAGVFCSYGYGYTRSGTSAVVGFRLAYAKLPTA